MLLRWPGFNKGILEKPVFARLMTDLFCASFTLLVTCAHFAQIQHGCVYTKMLASLSHEPATLQDAISDVSHRQSIKYNILCIYQTVIDNPFLPVLRVWLITIT